MSGYRAPSARIYLVRWRSSTASPERAWDSRVFRLKRAALEWFVILSQEGHAAEMFVADAPRAWAPHDVNADDIALVSGAVEARLRRRRVARERWAGDAT